MFVWVIEKQMEGVFNGTAPNPVTNAELMETLRKVLGRPWAPPAPKFAMKAAEKLLDLPASLALDSTRVVPRAALGKGFGFKFEAIEPALRDLLVEP
jgi:hypothetical protein